jgi:hypothetical protein
VTTQEHNEIFFYNRMAPQCLKVDDDHFNIDETLACSDKGKGILSKIAEVITNEPFTASFR